jgi:hypothetical protein
LILYGSLARPERFERPTLWFVARYSIQLSYGRAVRAAHYTEASTECKALVALNVMRLFVHRGAI